MPTVILPLTHHELKAAISTVDAAAMLIESLERKDGRPMVRPLRKLQAHLAQALPNAREHTVGRDSYTAHGVAGLGFAMRD